MFTTRRAAVAVGNLIHDFVQQILPNFYDVPTTHEITVTVAWNCGTSSKVILDNPVHLFFNRVNRFTSRQK